MLKTLERAAAQELVRQVVIGQLEPLLSAQLDNAVVSGIGSSWTARRADFGE